MATTNDIAALSFAVNAKNAFETFDKIEQRIERIGNAAKKLQEAFDGVGAINLSNAITQYTKIYDVLSRLKNFKLGSNFNNYQELLGIVKSINDLNITALPKGFNNLKSAFAEYASVAGKARDISTLFSDAKITSFFDEKNTSRNETIQALEKTLVKYKEIVEQRRKLYTDGGKSPIEFGGLPDSIIGNNTRVINDLNKFNDKLKKKINSSEYSKNLQPFATEDFKINVNFNTAEAIRNLQAELANSQAVKVRIKLDDTEPGVNEHLLTKVLDNSAIARQLQKEIQDFPFLLDIKIDSDEFEDKVKTSLKAAMQDVQSTYAQELKGLASTIASGSQEVAKSAAGEAVLKPQAIAKLANSLSNIQTDEKGKIKINSDILQPTNDTLNTFINTLNNRIAQHQIYLPTPTFKNAEEIGKDLSANLKSLAMSIGTAIKQNITAESYRATLPIPNFQKITSQNANSVAKDIVKSTVTSSKSFQTLKKDTTAIGSAADKIGRSFTDVNIRKMTQTIGALTVNTPEFEKAASALDRLSAAYSKIDWQNFSNIGSSVQSKIASAFTFTPESANATITNGLDKIIQALKVKSVSLNTPESEYKIPAPSIKLTDIATKVSSAINSFASLMNSRGKEILNSDKDYVIPAPKIEPMSPDKIKGYADSITNALHPEIALKQKLEAYNKEQQSILQKLSGSEYADTVLHPLSNSSAKAVSQMKARLNELETAIIQTEQQISVAGSPNGISLGVGQPTDDQIATSVYETTKRISEAIALQHNVANSTIPLVVHNEQAIKSIEAFKKKAQEIFKTIADKAQLNISVYKRDAEVAIRELKNFAMQQAAKDVKLNVNLQAPKEGEIRDAIKESQAIVHKIYNDKRNKSKELNELNAELPNLVGDAQAKAQEAIARLTKEIEKDDEFALHVKMIVDSIKQSDLKKVLAPAQKLLNELALIYHKSVKLAPEGGIHFAEDSNMLTINDKNLDQLVKAQEEKVKKAEEGIAIGADVVSESYDKVANADDAATEQVKNMAQGFEEAGRKVIDTARKSSDVMIWSAKSINESSQGMIKSFKDVGRNSVKFKRDIISNIYAPVSMYYKQFGDDPLAKMRISLKQTNSVLGSFAQSMGLYFGGRMLIGQLQTATSSAINFGMEIRRIQSLATDFNFDKLYDSLLKLDARFGNVIHNARALYWAYSSGVRGTEEDLVKFTEIMSQTAITIQADVMPTMNAATTLMNAYNLSAKDATMVGDLLFTIIKEGKASAGQLVNSLGNIVATSSAINASLDELGASIATLTKTIGTNKALTYLNNIMGKLANPTDDVREAAAELGIELSATAIRAKGFSQTMKEIHDATGGDIGKLAKIFPDLRGQRAALTLLSTQYTEFLSQLDKFQNKSGNMEEALGIITDTPEANFRALSNAMMMVKIQAGQSLLSFLTLGGELNKVVEGFNKLSTSGKTLIGNLLASGAGIATIVGLQKAWSIAQYSSLSNATSINLATLSEAKNRLDMLVSDREHLALINEQNLALAKQKILDIENSDEQLRELQYAREKYALQKKEAALRLQATKVSFSTLDANVKNQLQDLIERFSEVNTRVSEARSAYSAALDNSNNYNLDAYKNIQSLLKNTANNFNSQRIKENRLNSIEALSPELQSVSKLYDKLTARLATMQDDSTDPAMQNMKIAMKGIVNEIESYGNLSDLLANWSSSTEEQRNAANQQITTIDEIRAKLGELSGFISEQESASVENLVVAKLKKYIDIQQQELNAFRGKLDSLKGLVKNETDLAALEEIYNAQQENLNASVNDYNALLDEKQRRAELGLDQMQQEVDVLKADNDVQKANNKIIKENSKRLAENAEARVKYITATKGASMGEIATRQEIAKINQYISQASPEGARDEKTQLQMLEANVNQRKQEYLAVKNTNNAQYAYLRYLSAEKKLLMFNRRVQQDTNSVLRQRIMESGKNFARMGISALIGSKLGMGGAMLSMLPWGDMSKAASGGLTKTALNLSVLLGGVKGGLAFNNLNKFAFALHGVNNAAIAATASTALLTGGVIALAVLAGYLLSNTKAVENFTNKLAGADKARERERSYDEQLKLLESRRQASNTETDILRQNINYLKSYTKQLEEIDKRMALLNRPESLFNLKNINTTIASPEGLDLFKKSMEIWLTQGVIGLFKNRDSLTKGKITSNEFLEAFTDGMKNQLASHNGDFQTIAKAFSENYLNSLAMAEEDAFANKQTYQDQLSLASKRSTLAKESLKSLIDRYLLTYAGSIDTSSGNQREIIAQILEVMKNNTLQAKATMEAYKQGMAQYISVYGRNEEDKAYIELSQKVSDSTEEFNKLEAQLHEAETGFSDLTKNIWETSKKINEARLAVNNFMIGNNSNRASFAQAILGADSLWGRRSQLQAYFNNADLLRANLQIIRQSGAQEDSEEVARAAKDIKDNFLNIVEWFRKTDQKNYEFIKGLDQGLTSRTQGGVALSSMEALKLRTRTFDLMPEFDPMIASQDRLRDVIANLNDSNKNLINAITDAVNSFRGTMRYQLRANGLEFTNSNLENNVYNGVVKGFSRSLGNNRLYVVDPANSSY